MKKLFFFFTLVIFSCAFSNVMATHIVGGEMTYKYLYDTIDGTGGVKQKYQVSLIIYEDCKNGLPEVIAQDNPAFLAVYSAAPPFTFFRKDSVFYSSSIP